jgi:hypothetical protein
MAEPAPKGKRRSSHVPESRGRAPDPGVITEPLTPDLIEELGTGGPWKSDDEFERWMDILADARRDDAA